MANSLSLNRTLTLSGSYVNDSTLCNTTDQITSGSASFPTLTRTIANGTGAGQCNKWYRSYRTLAAGAADNLDLAGSLLDPFGNTLTFTGIKYIAIALVAASANERWRAISGEKRSAAAIASCTDAKPTALQFFAGVIPAARITSRHLTISLRTLSPSSAGVDGKNSAPCARKRSRISR